MYCIKCGTPNDKAAKFCIKCGAVLSASLAAPPVDAPPSPMQSKPGQGIRWKIIILAVAAVIVLAALLLAGKALLQQKPATGQKSEDAEPGIAVPRFRFLTDPEMVHQSNPWAIPVGGVRWYGEIAYGEVKQGSVEESGKVLAPYLWNSWGFRGDAGDVISIDVSSVQLHPLVELFDSSDTEEGLLLKTGGEHSRTLIEGFTLPYTGTYYIVVGGVRNLFGDGDTGEYEITLRRDDQ